MSVVPEPSMSASRMRRWSNWSGLVEPGRVVHGDLGAEAAVAEVRPVADLAVADAHEVGEAVAADMSARKIDWVPSAKTRRGPFSSSSGLADALRPGRSRPRASDGYQVKTSSSVIRTSARPSPSRSTNAGSGRRQSRLGSDGERRETAPSPRPRSRS